MEKKNEQCAATDYYYSLGRTSVSAFDDVHNTRYCYSLYDDQSKNIIL